MSGDSNEYEVSNVEALNNGVEKHFEEELKRYELSNYIKELELSIEYEIKHLKYVTEKISKMLKLKDQLMSIVE